MKISFPTVKWDTFDKVWINFLISDDLAQLEKKDVVVHFVKCFG